MSRKPVAVYDSASNPAVDLPVFYASNADAAARCALRTYRRLSSVAIQQLGPPREAAALLQGSFLAAWAKQPSAGFMVWQMRKKK
jgi:DNA-directed RNA polymerase specialized sigma24 family protein